MRAVVDEVRAVVRQGGDEKCVFDALRAIGSKHLPRRRWDKIRVPVLFEADVLETTKWINGVVALYQASNAYVALDTLNENDGQGKNVSTGMTRMLDSAAELHGWDPKWEGPRECHLVWGLFELHQSYLKWGLEYPARVLADYVMFMGYSGLVYAAAVERSTLRENCRFVWGFGEDMPFPLALTSPEGTLRL